MRIPALALAVALALLPTGPAYADSVTAHLERPHTHTGRDVDVTGRTAPGVTEVRLEQLDGDRWVRRSSAEPTSSGRYRLPVRAYAVGSFTYRVVAGEAVSDDLSLEVLGRGKPTTWATRYPELYRWDPCQVITYRVNADLARPSWRREVPGAIERVARQSGLRFRYLGRTDFVPQPGDTNPDGVDLVIAWARQRDTGYLSGPRHRNAYATSDTTRVLVPTTGGTERALTNGRIVVDRGSQKYMHTGFGAGYTSTDGSPSTGTRGRLLMHEIAHVVGLGHVDEVGSSEQDQVMYPFMIGRLAAWGAGDATGFSQVGADAGCFAPPSRGDRGPRVVRISAPIS